jgi:hypothetical protein
MTRSLTMLAYDGDGASLLASLRAAHARIADAQGQLFVFEGTSSAIGAKVPNVLVLIRSTHEASAETLAGFERALAHEATPTMRACFDYLRSFGAHEGQETQSLLIGMTDCASPDVRAAFEAWYDEHHAIDVVRSGMYFVAERHQRIAGDAPEFLAVYGTTGEEPETFQRYFAWEARDRARTPAALVRNVWTFRAASPEVMTWN